MQMSNRSGPRQYIGPQEANTIEWKVKKEIDGRRAYRRDWKEFVEIHDKWIKSDIRRTYRKPSQHSLEWLAWQRKFEVPQAGEWMTRHQRGQIEPEKPSCCKPKPWPCTTSGEVGWLGQHKNCQLEIYDMKYNQKPPLPWHMQKISNFPIY